MFIFHPFQGQGTTEDEEECEAEKDAAEKDDDDEEEDPFVKPQRRNKRGILGTVEHYAIRVEYQGRGKAHYHVDIRFPSFMIQF